MDNPLWRMNVATTGSISCDRYPDRAHANEHAHVAQRIERLPPEQEVAGSNPAVGARSTSTTSCCLQVDVYDVIPFNPTKLRASSISPMCRKPCW